MEVQLGEVIELNPRETIVKNTIARKISMNDLEPFTRDISTFSYERYSGGTKFRNNDVLLARITPCLENGKTAFVNILDQDEVAFGSTEYFVLRGKKGLIDPYYLYYLSISQDFRNVVIRSMTGTSGRQRAQKDSILDYKLNLPNIQYQRAIAAKLKVLDDKIRLNKQINDNLEAQAQTIFKSWFIDAPESSSWETGTFSDIIDTMIAGDWGKASPVGNNTEMVYCIRGADIPDVKSGNKGKMPTRFILPKNYVAKHLVAGDVVVEISGGSPTQSTGRIVSISQSLLDRYDKGMVCTNFCKAMKPKSGYSMFLYYYWQYLYDRNVFFLYENGTTGIKNLDISGFIETEPIILPPVELVEKFDAFCHSVFDVIFANGLQNEKLANMRDALLSKLMSGEIDASDLDL